MDITSIRMDIMYGNGSRCLWSILIFTFLVAGSGAVRSAFGSGGSLDDYLDLPLEDLLSIQVTSVAKKKQQLNEVASAVFVITREDIHRSGVTSIPEALRMAPGIQVARIDANKWAIASRGFNSQFTNKLLVMIDGRTVYSPSFSGVYWDAQDTLLEDIERIEVIRGPGATVWGANAVNGVINIITREASATRGGLLTAGVGNEEKGFMSLRYGAALGEHVMGRGYLKYNSRDSSYIAELDGDAGDQWESLRGGFRLDGRQGRSNTWSLQGDAYHNNENQRINIWKDPTQPANQIYAPDYLAPARPDSFVSSGWNLLGKWHRQLSATTSATLQFYYDHTRRQEIFLTQEHDTVDLDLQHQFRPLDDHEIIWGLGYRHIRDDFANTFMVAFLPEILSTDLFSAFVQDEIELIDNTLRLTIGSKFEHNDYTGAEVQPSGRLVWLLDDRSTLWGSISRAVRTPSRMEASAKIITQIVPLPEPYGPAVLHVYGSDQFRSEEMLAYELGYRTQPRENLSLDIALFYNIYNNLQTFEQINPSQIVSDTLFANKLSADSHGLEISVDWRPLEWWRLQANYSYLEITSRLDDDSGDCTGSDLVASGSSPRHQYSLRSMMDLGNRVHLDTWIYHVDGLDRSSYYWKNSVPSYTGLSIRLAWNPLKDLELSLAAQNLLDDHHPEFIGENMHLQPELERSVYLKLHLDF